MICLGLALAIAAAQVSAAPAAVQTPVSETPLVGEAIAFMEGYASDLIAGNRTGVSDRYDRSGAYLLVQGAPRRESHAAIAAIYAGSQWSALPRFQWHDLNYVPAGPDSIVVLG